MDNEWKGILPKLPTAPCEELQNQVLSEIYDDNGESALGEALILFNRESVELADHIKQTMCAEDWAAWERSRRRRWGARCTCSICNNDFIAGWVSRERLGRRIHGIRLAGGEDGMVYDGYVDADDLDAETYMAGETIACPCCYALGTLTARNDLKNGRIYRMMQAETVAVDGYVAVMYWMVERRQFNDATDMTHFLPHQALVIDRDGRLHRCRAEIPGGDIGKTQWRALTTVLDPMQQPYHSYDAEYGRRIGGWTLAYGPDLAGTTGEKTALDKYIGAGGAWPGAYLKLWIRRPQLENLMRQGLTAAVVSGIDDALNQAAYVADLQNTPTLPWVDWREVRPHKMLHMSREAFRVIRGARWLSDDAACWNRYRLIFPGADALEYEELRLSLGRENVDKLLDMVQAGWDDLIPVRVARYLTRQDRLRDGVQLLIDYRKLALDMELGETAEVLWPRDLHAAHDRTAQAWADSHELQWQAGFTTTYAALRGLEWADGDLCIVIPKTEQELVDEGRVLRHCVGSYGRTHCSGKPIFFIRHRRRPERSYYTLNIDLTGKLPKEIQLHGYGNERHGPNKEHKHSIPRGVREFADRWQREVLLPWFADRQRKQAREDLKKEIA